MRKIILKKLGKEGEVGILSYKEMIKSVLQFPTNPQAGFTIDEIRANVRILDILDKATDEFILEDFDYSKLKTSVDNAKFGMAHANIVQFVDDIDHAEAFAVKEK